MVGCPLRPRCIHGRAFVGGPPFSDSLSCDFCGGEESFLQCSTCSCMICKSCFFGYFGDFSDSGSGSDSGSDSGSGASIGGENITS
jgi:hypothetical protein